jgi:UDP-glucose 4-epimerase
LDKDKPIRGGDFTVVGDVCDSSLNEIYSDVDVVVHLAAQSGVEASTNDPVGTFNNNVFGTLQSLEAACAAGVKRFIFASSGGTVLGQQQEPLHEELIPNPVTPYGASKLACEAYCKAYNYTYGLETVILRFSNVYGPHSERKGFNLIPRFIINAIRNAPCYINGDGFITKDYIFVEDLIDTIISAALVPNAVGQVYQVGTGVAVDINNIALILDDLSNKFFGRSLKLFHKDERLGDISYECNVKKVKKELSFSPKYDLEVGLETTFKWFLNNMEA